MHQVHYKRGILAVALSAASVLTVVALSMSSPDYAAKFGVQAGNGQLVAVRDAKLVAPGASKVPGTINSGKGILVKHLSKKYKRSEGEVTVIVNSAFKEAAKTGMSPLLILAVIEKESSLRPTAESKYGGLGLMQVVPRWHMDKLAAHGHPTVLMDPEVNINVGSKILAEYIGGYAGDVDKALKRYSGSARNYAARVKMHQNELEQVWTMGQVVLLEATATGG